MNCPLCKNTEATKYHEDKFREYFKCSNCALVYVPSSFHLSDVEENARYDQHNNDPNDERYVGFLSKMLQPMLDRIKPGDRGLDFGSGPQPVLAGMFKEKGFDVAIYDKFYATDESVLRSSYDFMTMTEVIEHLADPMVEVRRIWQCLKSGGSLGIMTKSYEGQEFKTWNYKNDQTHVCFFSKKSFEWLAAKLEAELERLGEDVWLLKKS